MLLFLLSMMMRLAVAATPLLTLLLAASPAVTADAAQPFQQCVAGLGERARAEGLTGPAVTQALAGIRFEQQVIDADRRQPEFVDTFASYLERRLTPERINGGRRLLQQHRGLLVKLEQQYGVPGEVLVSFWGLESNYGGFFGRIPVLNSLATLACDARRGSYFTEELLNALRLVQRGAATPQQMVGSWAGAMGHTQFMPSTWLRYAVDGDGDGRIDLWGSTADALTSAANYLQQIGWRRGERWGDEVMLPATFAYELAGRQRPQPLSRWRELGVKGVDGEAERALALLVPAGHRGPAFLVGDNFEVILRWNRSEFYALAVGLLADRLVGRPPLRVAPPADAPRLSRAQVESIQQRLAALGFAAGEVDGVLGPATRDALRRFQQQRGMVADGFPDTPVLQALGVL
jgi:membrane-bound lytic murein transglycosylase B